jgi:hypothetical protein
MKSEALTLIKTMHDIKTDLDVRRARKVKATDSLLRTKEEMESLESIEDKHLAQVLDRERRRFSRQDAAVERFQKKLLASREKLAGMINKNHRITELRHELQRGRYEGKDPNSVAAEVSGGKRFKEIEVRY